MPPLPAAAQRPSVCGWQTREHRTLTTVRVCEAGSGMQGTAGGPAHGTLAGARRLGQSSNVFLFLCVTPASCLFVGFVPP